MSIRRRKLQSRGSVLPELPDAERESLSALGLRAYGATTGAGEPQ